MSDNIKDSITKINKTFANQQTWKDLTYTDSHRLNSDTILRIEDKLAKLELQLNLLVNMLTNMLNSPIPDELFHREIKSNCTD